MLKIKTMMDVVIKIQNSIMRVHVILDHLCILSIVLETINFVSTVSQIGAQIMDIKVKVPLSDEIICQNGGSYIHDVEVICHKNGTCAGVNRNYCTCPDGSNGIQCKYKMYFNITS